MLNFPKSKRVLKKKSYDDTLSCGKKAVSSLLVIIAKNSENPRLGLIVSRKVGKAHQRNKVKRRVREIFRLAYPELVKKLKADIVVIARPEASHATYRSLKQAFEACTDRLAWLLQKQSQQEDQKIAE